MTSPSATPSPCVRCGACCAVSRVLFHRDHLEPAGVVPADRVLGTPVPGHVAMRGTTGPEPRCEALSGTVGEAVRCTIYDRRPPPCRDFTASYADGRPHEGCDEARRRHGLEPLVG